MSDNQKIKPMKQKKPGDRVLPPSVRDLVPESQGKNRILSPYSNFSSLCGSPAFGATSWHDNNEKAVGNARGSETTTEDQEEAAIVHYKLIFAG